MTNYAQYASARQVGIEIEVESHHVHDEMVRTHLGNTAAGWTLDLEEGSLRAGAYGWEIKHTRPIRMAHIHQSLNALYPIMTGSSGSWRAAVHCHVDVSQISAGMDRVWALCYIYDDVLFELFSPERRESNFCVPVGNNVAEAQQQMTYFKTDPRCIHENYGKYRSINLTSINKFGSIEFRHMKTPTTDLTVSSVKQALYKIVDFATVTSNIISVAYSSPSTESMIERVLSGNFAGYLPEPNHEAALHMLQVLNPIPLQAGDGLTTALATSVPRPPRERTPSIGLIDMLEGRTPQMSEELRATLYDTIAEMEHDLANPEEAV